MRARKLFLVLLVLVFALWINNTSLFIDASNNGSITRLIARRGVHQIYTGENRTNHTCRAESVKPIQHHFIENTIASMQAAFEYGADVVELDVHLTTDNILAVYHDWRLECQTDGTGVTNKQSYDYLKTLDLGYGFTDDGKTFPLRGAGIGQMPTLQDVFSADLPGEFLVNFKSRRESYGRRFVELLPHIKHRGRLFGVYGGGAGAVRITSELEPSVRGFDRDALKSCLKNYLFLGWSGRVPTSCRNRIIVIPIDYAPYLWGWPHKFTNRMKAANTEVILWGPYDGSGFSSGIDDLDTLSRVPDYFDGYIWTNKIELIGPVVKAQ